ncbi:MAG: alanine--tRNA ligase [Methylococcales bacterium]|nr:alanine--tRNA ligase [Methylococcales bacterium]
MKYMTSAEVRSAFLNFFKQNGHSVELSSSLVPHNDPTLLFTNAGMVQFKDLFLGREQREFTRAATSQRCVRAGGKHNDLENVGYTARHHTFFEMLGNFSFGDYFKKEAIHFAWEFLVNVLEIPKEKLWVTVFEEDDEAANIWINEIGVSPDRLSRIGAKDNFWSMGDTGPCGPCSEIFYDHGEDIFGGPPGTPDEDGDRYIEIWNLVFMQYDRSADGTLTPLPKPSVDTGMGLERISAVMQNVHNNYDIDLFQNLLKAAASVTNTTDLTNSSLRVIADHIRSCAFMIVDGVMPSNEGRGYVLRRIIRRAIRHGYRLGTKDIFFHKLVAPLVQEMGEAFPELRTAQTQVEKVLEREGLGFAETIEQGMQLLYAALDAEQVKINNPNWKSPNVRRINDQITCCSFSEIETSVYVHDNCLTEDDLISISQQNREDKSTIELCRQWRKLVLPGQEAFKLHDTYGFPLDLTLDVCRELDVTVDEAGFEKAMEAQRDRARSASHFGADSHKNIELDSQTEFTGYELLDDTAQIVALFKGGEAVEQLNAGEEGVIVLDKTPFYGESGGQVGDSGTISTDSATFEVADTQKQAGSLFLHQGKVSAGALKVGQNVKATVDMAKRKATELNHSATHLLHAALRQTLGEHVAQKGSLVNPERLRFDFSHFEPLTADEIATMERLVNEQIRLNNAVSAQIMAKDDAVKAGAMALFGEKYGAEVRVLKIGEFSTELCGGTHVARAGDIGCFKIIGENGVAAGVRRIEAVTGANCLAWFAQRESALVQIADLVKGTPDKAVEKVEQLVERARGLEKQLERLNSKLASATGDELMAKAVEINGVKVLATTVENVDAKQCREIVEQLKNKLHNAVIVLASVEGEKVSVVAGVSKDQTAKVKAGELANFVAAKIGGKGGGKPDLAQAGGNNPAALAGALSEVLDLVKSQLD